MEAEEEKRLLEYAKALEWGTYGPGAVEDHRENGTPLPPMLHRPLGECETDHLVAILHHISPDTHGPNTVFVVQGAIRLILDHRGIVGYD